MIYYNKNIQSINDVDEFYYEKFLPYNLRSVPFYSVINNLIHVQDDLWTDEELEAYFHAYTPYNEYFASNTTSRETLYTKDFYESYPATSTDIWYEASILNNKSINKKGVKFWEFIIDPYLGTNLIQWKLIEKVDTRMPIELGSDILTPHGTVVEWWETNNLINAYSLKMEFFPGTEKVIFLIQSSLKMKNIESKLISVTDSECPSALRLDIGELNLKRLNGNYTNYYFDIGLCFSTDNDFLVDIGPYDENGDDLPYETDTIVAYSNNTHSHYYNAGIALGELDGVSYDLVQSDDILFAPYFKPNSVDYNAFITGAIVTQDHYNINRSYTLIGGLMPGAFLEPLAWGNAAEEIWDEDTWDAGGYIDTLRDVLRYRVDPTDTVALTAIDEFGMTAGQCLRYPEYTHKVELIKCRTFDTSTVGWTYDSSKFQLIGGKVESVDGTTQGSYFVTDIVPEYDDFNSVWYKYTFGFWAEDVTDSPYIAFDGVPMAPGIVSNPNAQITVSDKVYFSTGYNEITFQASSASHSIGIVDGVDTFNVDGFSVQKYTPSSINAKDGSNPTINAPAPSIYDSYFIGTPKAIYEYDIDVTANDVIDFIPKDDRTVGNVLSVKKIVGGAELTLTSEYTVSGDDATILIGVVGGVTIEYSYTLV